MSNPDHWVIKLIDTWHGNQNWLSRHGYGHVVLDDYNLDDVSIHSCLKDIRAAQEDNTLEISLPDAYKDTERGSNWVSVRPHYERLKTEEQFLELLLCIPEEYRDQWLKEGADE